MHPEPLDLLGDAIEDLQGMAAPEAHRLRYILEGLSGVPVEQGDYGRDGGTPMVPPRGRRAIPAKRSISQPLLADQQNQPRPIQTLLDSRI